MLSKRCTTVSIHTHTQVGLNLRLDLQRNPCFVGCTKNIIKVINCSPAAEKVGSDGEQQLARLNQWVEGHDGSKDAGPDEAQDDLHSHERLKATGVTPFACISIYNIIWSLNPQSHTAEAQ